MRDSYRDNFTDQAIVGRIRALENSPGMQETLAAIKSGMKDKVFKASPKGYFLAAVALFFTIPLLFYFPPLGAGIICLGVYRFADYLTKKKNDLTNLYIKNFLQPVLNEILPSSHVDYLKTFKDADFLAYMFDRAGTYKSECNIVFGDEFKTEFSNLTVIWRKGGKESSDTYDLFTGQILRAKLDIKIDGYLRIVPIKQRAAKKSYYRGLYGDEKVIATESIKFNDNYSVFSTDDFYTRLVLDPKIIDIFNTWADQMPVAMFIDKGAISILFQSGEYLFPAPLTEEGIDALSLAGEYDKVRENLADFYALIDIIGENL